MALCPAHRDTNPSLSISEGTGGRVLAKCFGKSNCSFADIRSALGFEGRSAAARSPAPSPKPSEPSGSKGGGGKPKKPGPLPTGDNVTQYHYTLADGTTPLVVVRRDFANKPKQITQWTPAKGGEGWISKGMKAPRPLYLLPELVKSTGRVVVVEGEKCVHAVQRAWPDQAVTTFSGGHKSWQHSDYTPLKGRDVTLLADASEGGRQCMRDLARHLHGLGCRVRIALPDGENDEDIADWLAADPQGTAKKVADLLREYEPPPIDEHAAGDLDISELRENRHYRLLGLAGEAVAIRIAAGRVLRRTRESMTSPRTLVSLAPMTFWCGLARTEVLGQSAALSLGDALLREVDQIGQVDLASMYGRGATKLPDGTIVYHLGDRLLIGGQVRDLDDHDMTWLAEPKIPLADSATPAQMRDAAAAVMCYRWATPDDGRRMLGWLVAAIIGGALEWRPHLYLAAPATVGKSWLLREVVQRLMGPLLIRIADATPAGITNLVESASLPIAIDEAEPDSAWVIELLKLLRISAGAEGLRVRADGSTGGVRTQAPRFTALLSSTAMPKLNRADASRLVKVRLGKPVEDWKAVSRAIREGMKHADGIRARIIRATPEIVLKAQLLADDLQTSGMDSREAMIMGALNAGWRTWGVDEQEFFGNDESNYGQRTDAGDCLLDILALRLRLPGGVERSVAEMLSDTASERTLADLMGIKRMGGDMALAPHHRGLERELRRTQWGNVDLRRLLLQMEGTQFSQHPKRFGKIRERAILFPKDVLAEVGVELGEAEAPAEEA